MYSNLPRSLKAECLVRTKVEEDEEVLKERQKTVETTRPAELAQFRCDSALGTNNRLTCDDKQID